VPGFEFAVSSAVTTSNVHTSSIDLHVVLTKFGFLRITLCSVPAAIAAAPKYIAMFVYKYVRFDLA